MWNHWVVQSRPTRCQSLPHGSGDISELDNVGRHDVDLGESFPTPVDAVTRRDRVRYRTPDRRSTEKRGFTTKKAAQDWAATVEVPR